MAMVKPDPSFMGAMFMKHMKVRVYGRGKVMMPRWGHG